MVEETTHGLPTFAIDHSLAIWTTRVILRTQPFGFVEWCYSRLFRGCFKSQPYELVSSLYQLAHYWHSSYEFNQRSFKSFGLIWYWAWNCPRTAIVIVFRPVLVNFIRKLSKTFDLAWRLLLLIDYPCSLWSQSNWPNLIICSLFNWNRSVFDLSSKVSFKR